MTRFTHTLPILSFVVSLALTAPARSQGRREPVKQTADRVFELSGVSSGVIVHDGCGDGRLTAALCRSSSCLVQGLSRDAAQVEQVRRWLATQELPGSVTVRLWEEDFLPYADNMVNLFIAEASAAPPVAEIMRVLAPLGVVCLRNGETWQKTVKPWPEEIDEWTHWLHAADGNPVAQDKRVGPPRGVQWISSPRWSKSHDTAPSLTGMVTARGRLFYIADTGPPAICDQDHSFETWHLCARDAFNGVLLWQRPLEDWGNRAWSAGVYTEEHHKLYAGRAHGGRGPWISNPRVVHKRLVAHGDRVYATLGFTAPVSQIDAATGKVIRTYDGTAFTSEIVFDDGVLFLVTDRAAQNAGKYGDRPDKSVVAIDPDSGRVLWERRGFYGLVDGKFRFLPATLTRLSLTVGDERVFVRDGDSLVALDANTGNEQWRTVWKAVPTPNKRTSDTVGDLLYSDGVLYSWQQTASSPIPCPIELLALSATDGSRLWQKNCGACGVQSIPSVYKARGLIWTSISPADPNQKEKFSSYQLLGLDPRSGEVVKSHDVDPIFQTVHHHRCYRNKATENYLIYSRNGLEFADFRTGEFNINRWARGICAYGIMPANGLIYAPPQQCICYPNARLLGFLTYAGASRQDQRRVVSDSDRLLKGPAYGAKITAPESADEDWPMFRHDGLRSASTRVSLPQDLKPAWNRDLGEPVTAPTTAWGKVFLAGLRTHSVIALDARTGRRVWEAGVDNRLDTPPTLWQGKVYCGTAGGYVYCLRADDGALVWRFNANPAYKSIVAYGNLESAWPVHGSVIVNNGVVYLAAGRSSYLDGGLRFYALDAETGAVLGSATHDTADRECHQAGASMQGAQNDLLVHDGKDLYVKNLQLDPGKLVVKAATWPYPPFIRTRPWQASFTGSPFVCFPGFLDDSLYDRSVYILNQFDSARKLVFNDDVLVGLQWGRGTFLTHNGLFEVGSDAYTVFARKRKAPTPTGKQIRVKLGDATLCTLDVPRTGGRQVWETVTAGNIALPGGTNQPLRLEFVGGGFSLNWVEFAYRGKNHVQNASFESGRGSRTDGWDLPNDHFSRSDEEAHEGIYSLRYSATGKNGVASQKIDLEPNTDYKLSVWMKLAKGSAGNMVFDTSDRFDRTCQFIVRASDGGGWKHYSGTFNSGRHAEVTLRCFVTKTFSGTGYFDNVTLMPANAKDPAPVARPTEAASTVNLPGKLQAEEFDKGGPGKAYHDTTAGNAGGKHRPAEDVDIDSTTDTGGGYCVTETADGEWLQYTVNALEGTYDVRARVAAPGFALPGGRWSQQVDLRVEAMALAGNCALVAGPPVPGPGTSVPDNTLATVQGSGGAALMRLDLSDGSPTEIARLSAPPVWDGLAIDRHGVFLALRNGEVVGLATAR